MTTITDIFKKYTNYTNDNYIKLFIEPFAIPLAWFVLNFTSWSANMVTVLGLLVGLSGCILGYFIHPIFIPIGYYTFFILDFVDGKVARGRGGGTAFGRRLDVLVDRAVFCAAAFSMVIYHTRAQHSLPILTLFLYTLAYFYMDIIEFTRTIMVAEPGFQNQNKKVTNYFHWQYWLPSRLSSPIFVLLIFLLSAKNFALAYMGGALAVACQFVLFMYFKFRVALK